jgi:hypothetical protein
MGITLKLQKRNSSIYVGALSETVYRDLLFLTTLALTTLALTTLAPAGHPGRAYCLVLLTTLVLTTLVLLVAAFV